jgi:cation diffusion facilitator family transporter
VVAPTRAHLTRFAWLSIGAALLTMAIKAAAYLVTGSVAFLSDAIESTVNLGAAIVALIALTVGARPPDEDHAYGHDKVEYFSSGVEGTLILVAAIVICFEAGRRLADPQPIEQPAAGIVIALLAAAINLSVALVLRRAGRRARSIALEADAQHLLSDVATSAAVILGVAAVEITGWEALDAIVGLLVGINLGVAGIRLMRRSVLGLMDTALPASDMRAITGVLESYAERGVRFHALRTRQAGARTFVSMHIQVPGGWTVQVGHELLEEIERDVRRALPGAHVFTHLEPAEDPVSWEDQSLDRPERDARTNS